MDIWLHGYKVKKISLMSGMRYRITFCAGTGWIWQYWSSPRQSWYTSALTPYPTSMEKD